MVMYWGKEKKNQKIKKNPHHHHHNNKTKTNPYLILLAVNHSCKNLSHSAQGRPQAKSAVPRKPKMMCLTVDHTAICSCFCRDVCLSGSGGEIPSFSAAGQWECGGWSVSSRPCSWGCHSPLGSCHPSLRRKPTLLPFPAFPKGCHLHGSVGKDPWPLYPLGAVSYGVQEYEGATKSKGSQQTGCQQVVFQPMMPHSSACQGYY